MILAVMYAINEIVIKPEKNFEALNGIDLMTFTLLVHVML